MSKKKILVVEDEPDFLELIKMRLEANNYEVITAADGKEALDRIKSTKPDAVLLDILMPNMDGFQTLERLKESSQTKSIPVIMLTAKSQLEDVTKAINLGAEDYIVKPFDSIALLNKIKKVLG